MAGSRDPSPVKEMSGLTDDELVRLFALARDRGDRDRAVAIWEQIVINNIDRVSQMVAAWRYPGSGDRVQDVDRDEAVSLAMWKVGRKMVDTFAAGASVELRAVDPQGGRLRMPGHAAAGRRVRQAHRRQLRRAGRRR